MNPSRIEQAIDEIYNYVEGCKPSKLAPSKVVVDREQLYDLLDELRLCAPEEIKRYQKIINNREGILNEAQQRAEDMLAQAQNQTAQILDQIEIVQTAYQRAEDIMKQATEEARELVNQAEAESNQMHKAALLYTNEILTDAQKHIEESFREIDNKERMLNSAMKNSIQLIKSNKEELMAQLEPEQPQPQQPQPAQQQRLEVEPVPNNHEQLEVVEREVVGEFAVSEDAFLNKAQQ